MWGGAWGGGPALDVGGGGAVWEGRASGGRGAIKEFGWQSPLCV